MRYLLLSLFLSISAHAAEAESPMIVFTNGDTLPGTLANTNGDQIIWKSPSLSSETPFFLDRVQEITMPYSTAPAPKSDHLAQIRFNPDLRQQNEKLQGDVIEGELISVTSDSIILDTWYAGRLTLNRNMVKDLKINDVSAPIYSGPLKQDEWTCIPDDSWKFEKNAYTTTGNGSVVKEFDKMPKKFRFSFTVAWKSRFSVQILFCADSIKETNPDSHYMLVLDSGTSYMQKRSSNPNAAGGIMRNGGMIGEYQRTQVFRNKEKSDLDLYVDTTTGLMALFADDQLVQQWNDVDPPVLFGKSIHFRQNSSNSKLSLSRMNLTEWDGSLPIADANSEKASLDNPDPLADEQRILLRNGDILLAKVNQIENSEINLKTRFNEMKLPISRVKSLSLTPAIYDERLLQNGDVRAWFPDGNYITFRLDSVTADGKLTGFAQHFGTASFDLKAFSRIEFNIYPSLIPKTATDKIEEAEEE